MRTALVLTGLPRDFERAAPNLRRCLIQRYSIRPEDVFISCGAIEATGTLVIPPRQRAFFKQGKSKLVNLNSSNHIPLLK